MKMSIKTAGLILIAIALLQGIAHAGFELPRGVYTYPEIENAKQEAQKKQKPIAVIWSDTGTDCGLCSSASLTMMDELKRKAVIVYLSTKTDEMPAFAREAFNRGKYIPKVGVFDMDLKTTLGVVIYEDVDEKGTDAFDDVLDKIRAYRKTLK